MGPRCLRDFLALHGAGERLAAIKAARSPGTIPWDVAEALEREQRTGRINVLEDEVVAIRDCERASRDEPRSTDEATSTQTGRSDSHSHAAPVTLLSRNGSIFTDQVILATGFDPAPPASELVTRIAAHAGLAVNDHGYPAIDNALQWGPGFYVSSAAAELELGPMAPNIYGAHAAARRMFPILQGKAPDKRRDRAPWIPLRPS